MADCPDGSSRAIRSRENGDNQIHTTTATASEHRFRFPPTGWGSDTTYRRINAPPSSCDKFVNLSTNAGKMDRSTDWPRLANARVYSSSFRAFHPGLSAVSRRNQEESCDRRYNSTSISAHQRWRFYQRIIGTIGLSVPVSAFRNSFVENTRNYHRRGSFSFEEVISLLTTCWAT